MSETLLVVEDEPRLRRIVELALEDRGYRVLTAGSAEEAEPHLDGSVDAVIADIQLPGRSGLELLADVRERRPDVPVILMTAFGTVESAVEAMRAGAYDYVLKPFGMEELERLVTSALEERQTAPDVGAVRGPEADEIEGVVARSPAMRRVMGLVRQVAHAPSTVLITGETGVGKEVVARALHQCSPRSERPFVAVNCAAIPGELLEAELFGAARGAYTGAIKDRPGKLEVADGGTLFLDEIGDMPLSLQPKLLRVVQEGTVERLGSNVTRSVDVRFCAATHRDLETEVREGRFREDLYYRINVLPIAIPPLRERPEDVEPLTRLALARLEARLGVKAGLGTGVLERLGEYHWPGNVRELFNVLERALLLAPDGVVRVEHLPWHPGAQGRSETRASGPRPLHEVVAEAERRAIQAALEATGDNKTRAAELLGISVRTLWYKLDKLGLR